MGGQQSSSCCCGRVQGNGVERCKLHFEDDGTFIVDVFNSGIYPRDGPAKKVMGCLLASARRVDAERAW